MRVSITSDLTVTAEVEGIEIRAALTEAATTNDSERGTPSAGTPRHRKTARRTPSAPLHDPGGPPDYDEEEAHLPTARDLATSFLDMEPEQEKQELEAVLLSQSKTIEDSIHSDTSEDAGMGTGNTLGLPTFLATILQSVVDRLTVKISNVHLRCDATLPLSSPEDPTNTFSLSLNIGVIHIHPVNSDEGNTKSTEMGSAIGRRHIGLDNITLDILCDGASRPQSSYGSLTPSPILVRSMSPNSSRARNRTSPGMSRPSLQTSPRIGSPTSPSSTVFSQRGRFADAEEFNREGSPSDPDFSDIRTGEDSHSYSTRRSRASFGNSQPLYHSSEQVDGQDLSQSIAEFQSSVGSSNDNLLTPSYLAALSDPQPLSSAPQEEPMIADPGPPYGQDLHVETAASPPRSPSSDGDIDPMVQSVIYSQEMGKSMYLSAISQDIPPSPEYKRTPGYFPDDVEYDPSLLSTLPVRTIEKETGGILGDGAATPTGPRSIQAGQNFTSKSSERSRSAARSDYTIASPRQVCRQLVVLDTIKISLPGTQSTTKESDTMARPFGSEGPMQQSVSVSAYSRNMPGTFSSFAELGSSRRIQESFVQDQPSASDLHASSSSTDRSLEIDIGNLHANVDTATIQLLSLVVANVISGSATSAPPSKSNGTQNDGPILPKMSVRLKHTRVTLLERLLEKADDSFTSAARPALESPKVLIQTIAKDTSFGLTPYSNTPDITFAIRRLAIGTAHTDLVSFRKSTSHETMAAPDILVKLQRSKFTLQNKPLTDIRAYLRPVHLNFDLPAIDEALASFGGLGAIVEMSASKISSENSQADNGPARPKRGVRFEEDVKTPDDSTIIPEWKLDVSIQGVSLFLKSQACSLDLQCSLLKTSVRPRVVLMSVANASLTEGPVIGQARSSRFQIDLKDCRLHYLASPEDVDLERLLSLITPSKNKYESDDDILVDTLLRQRRKGAVLRLKITSIQVDVTSWSFISDAQMMGDELRKFAAVTKYLPEDDRPGLLVLPRLGDVHARLPVNEQFGTLEVSLKDIQAAQIGLPALVALSIGGVRAGPLGGHDVVHEIRADEQLPLIMMRVVGDEIEPTLKIKMFNLCLEYSVATLVDLTGTGSSATFEHPISDIASSMLDSIALGIEGVQDSPIHPAAARSNKKFGLDVLLHDCALGLQPTDSQAKGMLVLTNTKFGTTLPVSANFAAILELHKASLYIVDRQHEPNNTRPATKIPQQGQILDRLASHLVAQGFVSVSSIMAAKVMVNVTEDDVTKKQIIDLDVRDELFLLETCADSTQTLIMIFNGLSPPAPATSDPKFRTEIMTLPEMLASFTGDSVQEPLTERSTLFDVEETSPDSEIDELLMQSAMSSSLYGPVGESADLEDDHTFFEGDKYDTKTVESFIEEEGFFEITDTTAKQHLSNDALRESIQKQCLPHGGTSPAELKPFHFGNAHLNKMESTVLGAPYRFNTPATPFLSGNYKETFPFQVRVRDVHVIWNLYDGYDWEQTRSTIAEAVEEVEQKLEARKQSRRRSAEPEDDEESVIGDCLFNSIYIGIPTNRDPIDLRREISRGIDDMVSESESYATSGTSRPTQYSLTRQVRQGPRKRTLRLTRSKAHKIAFELRGVSLDFAVHAPGSGEVQSSVDVRLRDFEIFDNVPTSTWRKFLTYFHDEENMREMMKPMIHLELLTIRPVAELSATELSIRVSG